MEKALPGKGARMDVAFWRIFLKRSLSAHGIEVDPRVQQS